MKVVVVGAGMYVTGRGTTAPGTVLAALCEASRDGRVSDVVVLARLAGNRQVVDDAASDLRAKLGVDLRVRYESIDHFAEEAADASCAIVVVPDDLHVEWGTRVLEADLHCLMAKPLAPTLSDARVLTELADRQAKYAAVELHKRWDPSNLVARRTLAEGGLGRLRYATVEFSQRIGVPATTFREWAARTNVFQYLGVHYVDMFRFLTGATPLRVSALGTHGVLSSRGVDTWDSVHASVVWRAASGEDMAQQLAIGWIDPETSSAASEQRLLLVGDSGRLLLDQKRRGIEFVSQNGVAEINPSFSQLLPRPDGQLRFAGYGYDSIRTFLDDAAAVDDGQVTLADLEGARPTFRESLVCTAVTDAATRSLEAAGAWMEIDDPATP